MQGKEVEMGLVLTVFPKRAECSEAKPPFIGRAGRSAVGVFAQQGISEPVMGQDVCVCFDMGLGWRCGGAGLPAGSCWELRQ